MVMQGQLLCDCTFALPISAQMQRHWDCLLVKLLKRFLINRPCASIDAETGDTPFLKKKKKKKSGIVYCRGEPVTRTTAHRSYADGRGPSGQVQKAVGPG
jgi:hypothetical protein